jgi:hypothetical protein
LPKHEIQNLKKKVILKVFNPQKWRKKRSKWFKLKMQPNNTWYNWGVDVQSRKTCSLVKLVMENFAQVCTHVDNY